MKIPVITATALAGLALASSTPQAQPTCPTAALGGSIEVPTIEGSRSRVTIPAGTQSGQHFRLRSQGMTVLRSAARGDL